MTYGHFDDAAREFVVTDPLTPRPWTNYLGNRRLQAFISQCAGGLMWYLEPESRRLTRYHYVAAPEDRPGFYVYVKDRRTGVVWNPHFAPTGTRLDSYECRHSPGVARFVGEKDGVRIAVDALIPLDDDALLLKVAATNLSDAQADLGFASYLEFGILERVREWWWGYLKYQFSLRFDADAGCIRHDYRVYEALYAPRMVVGCTEPVSGFECSRDAFLGRAGSLERPEALVTDRGLSNSELPLGGHACGVLGVDLKLGPGDTRHFAYIFAMGDSWDETDGLLRKYRRIEAVDAAMAGLRAFWNERLETLQAETGDAMVDRFINTWTPYQSLTLLGLPCSISTDHQGVDGLRYRDTTQYALTPATLDPPFAMEKMAEVFATQKGGGMGCCSFRPHKPGPPSDQPRRSDNTVWQVYTVKSLVEETGDLSYLDHTVPFRDGGEGSVYDHVLLGLRWIFDHRGPQGLPLLYYADWNDCLGAYRGDETETVMLGMQLVHSCRKFRELAARLGRDADAAWCDEAAAELERVINSDRVWDGGWYRRLLLADGEYVGGKMNAERRIWINTQTWSAISGVGDRDARCATAMESVHELLDTPAGLMMVGPPPGLAGLSLDERAHAAQASVGENGGVFNHTNAWAVIAEAMLGHNERAFEYYRRTLPGAVAERFGQERYEREPYVYASAVIGPTSDLFGRGGISWITGTATWMYVAATQYILGIKPTLDGLSIRPCLPAAMKSVRVRRRFRGCAYHIEIDNASRDAVRLEVDGRETDSTVVPARAGAACTVRCFC